MIDILCVQDNQVMHYNNINDISFLPKIFYSLENFIITVGLKRGRGGLSIYFSRESIILNIKTWCELDDYVKYEEGF